MGAEELLRKIEQGEIVTVNGKVICTGAMWYDRFVEECKKLEPNHPSIFDPVYDAAKKAAGTKS